MVSLDTIIQKLLDDNVLCPEDGITGRAILEEAYINIEEGEEGNNGNEEE